MWLAFHLPAFNGEGDVDECKCFFNTVAIHEDSHKILYAANYLTGPAHAKWRALHHQDGAATTTWEDFKNLILRCFKPCAAGDDAATAIKQKELSVGEYTDNFLDSRKLNRYISGLNPPLANFVNLRKPRNLQEAITLALQAERAAKAAAEAKPKETPPLTARYYQSFVALPPKKEEQPPSAPKKDVKLHFVVYSGDDDFGKWQRGRVNGHTVSFVASNSSDNFVSESAVSRLGLRTEECTEFSVETPLGTSTYTGNLVAPKLEFEIDGGYMGRMDFAVMKFSRHDFVLGHSFFGNNFQMFATELRVESDGYVYSFTLHSDPPCSVI
ncbi:hypothetical protein SELMODRAFT_438917 [Selaginella moellendorffii]|uniref:Retrotransposon gag domain-containing protein n=1 Tax=Selaginella moellendorffii TaxID=88036 RepID=D8R0G1_SELML|nr:hypothetical protein SELMODRAFT_438917 [Selaginella moellendorffii]